MKILVAVDLSRAFSPILTFAMDFVQRCTSEVWLVHVADPEPDFVGYEPGPRGVRKQVARKYHNAHRKLQEIADAFRESGINATALVIQGPTAEQIISEAEKLDVDLILAGGSRHNTVHRVFAGSVSARLIRRSPKPILIVPTVSPVTRRKSSRSK